MERLEYRRLLAITSMPAALANAFVSVPNQPANPIANEAGDLTRLYAEQLSGPNSPSSSASSGTAPSLQHRSDGLQVVGDSVEVEITADMSGADLLPQLEGLGMRIDGVFGHEVSGMLPIDQLPALAATPGVRYVRPAYAPQLSAGAVMTQGDKAELSDEVRRFLGFDGTGVTVGVISNSFNYLGGYAADVASGDLPANVDVIQDDANPNGLPDEGRAMLQIIHDVAPGASLAFAAAGRSDVTMRNSILNLYLAGARVIVDDISFPDEPMFQDGIIAQEVNYVAAHGVAYFSAAGNYSQNSYASAWSALNSAPRAADGAIPFNFNPLGYTDPFQPITLGAYGQGKDQLKLSFGWDSPSYTASFNVGSTAWTLNNINVYLWDPTTGLVAASNTDDATLNGDPIKLLDYRNPYASSHTFDLEFEWTKGPQPGYIKWIDNVDNPVEVDDYATNSSTIYGHANAAGAMAVGAADYHNTPANGVSPPVLETFSSSGGTPIFFDPAGNRYTSQIFRDAPAFVAPDGVLTTFFENGVFSGTSAAAPHAAAVAAVMLQAFPNATPAQIRAALSSTAIDMEPTTGFDFYSGSGLIDAPEALLSMGVGFRVSLNAWSYENDGTADAFRIVRSGSRLNFYQDIPGAGSPEELVFSGPIASIGAIYVAGSADDTTLTIDYSGGAIAPSINFDGGTGHAFLNVVGDSRSTVIYSPDPTNANSGKISVQTPDVATGTTVTNNVTFEDVYYALEVSAVAGLALETPNINNSLTVASPQAGSSWVYGTSNGVDFRAIEFANVPSIIVDMTSTNGGTPTRDSVTITAGSLVALGLQSMSFRTGAGDNRLILQTASLALPVAGGALAFSTEGTAAHFVSTVAANYALSDDSLQSSAGGGIALSGTAGLNLVTLDTTGAPAGDQIWLTPSTTAAFNISGNSGHLYVDLSTATTPALQVTSPGAGELTFGNRQPVTFAGMIDPSVAFGPFTLSAVEAAPTGLQTVGEFIDLMGAAPLANYSAGVDWGDGTTSTGALGLDSATGVLAVQGNHTYSEQGSYAVGVVLDKLSATEATAGGTAIVSDPALVAVGGFTLQATEGIAVSPPAVATFTDPAGAEPLANYSADIAWGDGTTSAGAIALDASAGIFTVSGTHTYTQPVPNPVVVVIHHGSAPDATATSTAAVSDPAVAATAGPAISATEGNAVAATVATFTDPAGALALSQYSVVIDWGDGTTASAGSLSYDSATQIFPVQGSHTYVEEGSDTIRITIHHGSAPDVTVTVAASVSDPAVAATGGLTVFATEGAAFGPTTVATFTDAGGAEPLADYTATIDWGDGTSASAGTLIYDSGDQAFTVQGIHTYSEEGSDRIRVTVHHDNAADVTVTSTASVSDAALNGTALAISGTEGTTLSANVATFIDADPNGAATDYSATIDWGDNSPLTTITGSQITAVGTDRKITSVFCIAW